MPLYEYRCPKCQTEFELKRPASEAQQSAKCPNCGAEAPRMISAFSSKLGFYIQGTGKPFRKEASPKKTRRG